MAITRLGPNQDITAAKIAGTINFKNILINGDMSIAQRGTSTASITSDGYYTIDRFIASMTTAGTWTQSQDTDVPSGQGFATSLKMDCTTANGSLSVDSILLLRQKIEGQNLQYLKKGTSNAESLTLSFWVKSNKTGTYVAGIYDNDNTRQISKSYTIDSASTWEKKTITFAGDTTGTLDNDNAASFYIDFFLSAGTNFTSGTLATSWESFTSANIAVGQVNLADDTANNFWITGVQLEADTSASDFEFLPYDVNLQRCQRYYEILQATDTYDTILATWNRNTSDMGATLNYKVIKRAEPSFSFSSGNTFRMNTATGDHTASSISSSNPTIYTAQINIIASGTPLTAGQAGYINMENGNGDAIIRMDAEL